MKWKDNNVGWIIFLNNRNDIILNLKVLISKKFHTTLLGFVAIMFFIEVQNLKLGVFVCLVVIFSTNKCVLALDKGYSHDNVLSV